MKKTTVRSKDVEESDSATAAKAASSAPLPTAMTGRASSAKAAIGDQPVFAYFASLPSPTVA